MKDLAGSAQQVEGSAFHCEDTILPLDWEEGAHLLLLLLL